MLPAFVVIVNCKPFVLGGCVSKFLSACASEPKEENRRHKASDPPMHYRLGPAEQDELEEQIRDLLAHGFIRP